jgi:hypothetical protein
VIEARGLLSGVTGHTTAKVTAQHGMIYADLRRRFGQGTAAAYAAGQLAALNWIRREAAALDADCDLSTRDSYLYAETPAHRDRLRREADAAAAAGLRAGYTTELDLPYPVAGAVRVADQAQFHPVRWLNALATRIPGDGSHLVEGARAVDVRQSGSQGSGSVREPSRRTSKCRWSPVELPVVPTSPIVSPASTDWPALTRISDWCA